MRISDWSSDVCSADLGGAPARRAAPIMAIDRRHLAMAAAVLAAVVVPVAAQPPQLAPEVERTTVAPEGRSFVSTPADERAAMERFTTYTFALARRDLEAAHAMLRPTTQAASPPRTEKRRGGKEG